MFVHIYVCTHPQTRPLECACIYGCADWDKSPVQANVWIQTHHAMSALQLPAGVHLSGIPQYTEACTLLPSLLLLHASVSAGGSHCGLQNTSLSGSGVLRTCVMLQLDFGCRHWDWWIAFVLLKTRGRAYGQAQDQNHCQCLALVYGLSLSPKGQDHHKSESTVSQSDPKIVV